MSVKREDLLVAGAALVIYALNPSKMISISPREAFVAARAFLAEAEKQIPGITQVLVENDC